MGGDAAHRRGDPVLALSRIANLHEQSSHFLRYGGASDDNVSPISRSEKHEQPLPEGSYGTASQYEPLSSSRCRRRDAVRSFTVVGGMLIWWYQRGVQGPGADCPPGGVEHHASAKSRQRRGRRTHS